jgi:hypothetical protein
VEVLAYKAKKDTKVRPQNALLQEKTSFTIGVFKVEKRAAFSKQQAQELHQATTSLSYSKTRPRHQNLRKHNRKQPRLNLIP